MAAAKRVLEEAAPLLPYDAVFRIEVSLSSQTTSAVVMRTTARLYNLEGVQSSKPSIGEASLSISLSPCEILPLPLPLSLCWAHVCVSGDAEWKSVAYGAPCIQLIRHGNGGPNSMFTIRVVVAEVESGLCVYMHERERERDQSKCLTSPLEVQSVGTVLCVHVCVLITAGISLWEGVVGSSSQYRAMQSNFHTFSSADCTYALQFVRCNSTPYSQPQSLSLLSLPSPTPPPPLSLSLSELEAERMLESMQDLLSQQQNLMVGVASQTSLESLVFKKPSSRPPRRLSKKDISSPCNFKHVSGVLINVGTALANCVCIIVRHHSPENPEL